MHLHLVREPERPLPEPVSRRSAKVVQLEARRQARLEAERREQARPRPAA